MAAVEFTITGDPARARQTAVGALSARQFTLAWTDEWTASAERGSRTKNVLLGAFAQYFKVGVAVRSLDDDHSVVRVESLTSGWMGGLWGANKTKSNLRELRTELGTAFESAGVLVDVRDL
jgi:hypothetical protein